LRYIWFVAERQEMQQRVVEEFRSNGGRVTSPLTCVADGDRLVVLQPRAG
jgi:hypothetical protein